MTAAPSEDLTRTTLLRLHRGDEGALQQLLAEHRGWIEAQVRRRLDATLRLEADTQDFVQEAMLDVLRDGPRFVVESAASFRALLSRIVENNVLDRVRYMHREQRDRRRMRDLASDSILMLDSPVRSVTEPPQRAERSEQIAWMRLALELLEPDDREVIRMREWEGLSFPQLGEQLGISEEAARKRHARALPRLAGKLKMLQQGQWQRSLDDAR